MLLAVVVVSQQIAAWDEGKAFLAPSLCIPATTPSPFFPFLSVFHCLQVVFLKRVQSKQTLFLPWPWGFAILGLLCAAGDPVPCSL